MIEKYSLVGAAAAQQTDTTVATSAWENGATIARTGVGVMTLTLDEQLAVTNGDTTADRPGSAVPRVSFSTIAGSGAAPKVASWYAQPDADGVVWTFHFFDHADAAYELLEDTVVTLELWSIGDAGVNA